MVGSGKEGVCRLSVSIEWAWVRLWLGIDVESDLAQVTQFLVSPSAVSIGALSLAFAGRTEMGVRYVCIKTFDGFCDFGSLGLLLRICR